MEWMEPYLRSGTTSCACVVPEAPWAASLPTDLLECVMHHWEREASHDESWIAAWYDCIGWTRAADRLWTKLARRHLWRTGFPDTDLVCSATWLSLGLQPTCPATPGEAARYICRTIKEVHDKPRYIVGPASVMQRWFGFTAQECPKLSRRSHPRWDTLYVWLKACVLAQNLHPEVDPRDRIDAVWAWRTECVARLEKRHAIWKAAQAATQGPPAALHEVWQRWSVDPPVALHTVLASWPSDAPCPVCDISYLYKEGLAEHVWKEHLTRPLRRCRTCTQFLPLDLIATHPCTDVLACPLDGTDPTHHVQWKPRGFKERGTLVHLHDIIW